MQHPFPTFTQARSRLLMEELSANERARMDGHTGGSGGSPSTALTVGRAPDPAVAPNTDKSKGARPPLMATKARAGEAVGAAAGAAPLRATPRQAAAVLRRLPRQTLVPG
ncbi:hypothetical protein D1007_40643 [Hordeum vulgare]|nr:hypothetical protein D1007_40643 [Hordeum vulgare]